MRYRIADHIIFDPEERTLTMEGQDESIPLPIPASRLLEFMLKRKDTLHERDQLLTEVWDKYGLKGSGSNLNQYISLLRRTLSGMNCEEFFITVPKVGFKINPAIEIVSIESHSVITVEKPQKRHDTPPQNLVDKYVPWISGKIMFFILATILITFISIVYQHKNIWNIRQIEPIRATFDSTCNIIYLNKTSDSAKENINKKAINYLKDRNRQCNKNNVFVASVVNVEQSSGIARSFLSLCREDQQGKIIDCNSLYSRR